MYIFSGLDIMIRVIRAYSGILRNSSLSMIILVHILVDLRALKVKVILNLPMFSFGKTKIERPAELNFLTPPTQDFSQVQ